MRIAVLSPHNAHGLPGSLAGQLNRMDGINAKSYTYLDSTYEYHSDVVLRNLAPGEFKLILEEIVSADIIHVFDEPFQTQNFDLAKHLRPNNTIFSYTPAFFNKNHAEIFFRHYQGSIVATSCPLTGALSNCPVPLVHMPPVLDFSNIPSRTPKNTAEPPVLAYVSQYGKRGHLDQILQVSFEIQQHLEMTFNWLENLNRNDYLREMANSSLFLDDLSFNGLSPLALEAMAVGLPVVANLSGLDFTLLPEAPVIPVTPKNLPQRLAEMLSDPALLAEIGDRSSVWVREHLDPQKAAFSWKALYMHVLTLGAPIADNPYFPKI